MILATLLSRIAAAEVAHNRPPGSVSLVAVSKIQPDDRVTQVLRAGQRVFGENYVQEAAAKWPAFRATYSGVQVHMIGPLQTNKARQAMALFDVIQSLDRPSLAQKLASLAQSLGTCPQLFVQVNTGSEPQKAGVLPGDLDGFLRDCRAMDLIPHGLMCIPPDGADPVPHFQALAAMAARHGLSGLSMGMSSDFEAAIAHGATHVRVGSALFGTRPPDESKVNEKR